MNRFFDSMKMHKVEKTVYISAGEAKKPVSGPGKAGKRPAGAGIS